MMQLEVMMFSIDLVFWVHNVISKRKEELKHGLKKLKMIWRLLKV